MTATAQTAAGNAAATATAAPVAQTASAGYQLGPNDELKISVFGQPDLSTTTRIKEDGTVLLALVGPVSAKGKTTTQLAQDIAAGYASGGYLTKPSVSVEVSHSLSRFVPVLGTGPDAGNYPPDRASTQIGRASGREKQCK